MNELSDKTVILAIFATLIIVFSLAFSLRPQRADFQPSIEWRENNQTVADQIKI